MLISCILRWELRGAESLRWLRSDVLRRQALWSCLVYTDFLTYVVKSYMHMLLDRFMQDPHLAHRSRMIKATLTSEVVL